MVKPGYKETEIGVIPQDWEIHYLNDLGDVVSGGTPKTTDSAYWNGDIAWCTPSDITSTKGKYIYRTERYLTDTGLKNSASTLMPANSLLVCTRATIGELKICAVPMATNQGFKNLRPNGHANVNFLYYLLQTKREKMYELAIGSTFLEISKSAICKIPLQCPPLEEQEKIAEVLSDMDDLIASLEKLIAKKKAVKQGAMQELLTGKKRLPGFDGEWPEKAIIDIGNVITGATPARDAMEFWNGDFPWISAQDFKGKYISNSQEKITPSGKKYCRCLPQGAVLVTCIASIGLNAIANCDCATNQQINAVICNDSCYNEYLYYKITFSNDILKNIAGQTAVPIVSKGQFESIKLRFPDDIREQQAIASILSDMDAEIEALEQKLAKCRQTKQGMMQQLLTGKIRLV